MHPMRFTLPGGECMRRRTRAAANRRASTLRRAFNFIRGVPLQRFYPQCESCSALQSVAVRSGAVRLVTHSVGVRYAVIAGAVVADDTRLAIATTAGGGVLVGCGVGAAPVDPSDDVDATVGIVDDVGNLDGIK